MIRRARLRRSMGYIWHISAWADPDAAGAHQRKTEEI